MIIEHNKENKTTETVETVAAGEIFSFCYEADKPAYNCDSLYLKTDEENIVSLPGGIEYDSNPFKNCSIIVHEVVLSIKH